MHRTEPTSSCHTDTASVRRGDIFYITRGEGAPTGSEIWPERFGLIISNDAINEKSDFVTVVFLTTSCKRTMPYHVQVVSGGKQATALCEQVFSVDKSRLQDKTGHATDRELMAINRAISLSLSTVGTGLQQCQSITRKWIMALEKHGISLSGNPGAPEPGTPGNPMEELNAYKRLCSEQARALAALAGTTDT